MGVRKRMYSADVVENDNFLCMSEKSQLLYFFLLLHSDDDGFCGSPIVICNMIDANPDNLAELERNEFIIDFYDRVVCIKHFLAQNTIDKRIKKDTMHIEHLKKLEITKGKVYTLKKGSKNT